MAIEKSQQLSKFLRKLSAYAAKHKNSINSSKFFIQKKARLKMENKTRWSSSFMMLDSFHKALKKQAFPPDDPCPINLYVLELYLQILQPAFTANDLENLVEVTKQITQKFEFQTRTRKWIFFEFGCLNVGYKDFLGMDG
ncbi:unnamed protein product [Brachionus calyciflorus]|uniref:Uncharacterized protein n=1 Tax=Brachionus calyciflorus TaxID=104777 RepID=A0A814S4R3_9BILA|nr:unnamed protein product [Brachionus calyciflorus]